ncbi:MAG: hypothetical protein IJ737_04405 [Ruminococcus sp.]|nr:hypothetical protein [Ruminococcus sp.]
MAKSKKNKKRNRQVSGNPQKQLEIEAAKKAAIEAKEEKNSSARSDKAFAAPAGDKKPLLARILVLAIAAVMLLGFVVMTAIR